MEIRIITVGKIKQKAWQLAAADFVRRIERYTRVREITVKDAQWDSFKNEDLVRTAEAEEISRKISIDQFIIALDMNGEQIASEELAEFLQARMLHGQNKLTFIIGGPFGLAPAILEQADFVLSLSKMTFLHEMSKVILLEQIYRAFTIIKGEKYHK